MCGISDKKNPKLAVLFPGIGYTCDKPLLYYSARAARERGWDVLPVPYGNFPANVKGNPEKMKECFYLALEQTEAILQDTDWSGREDILFVSKSIGTAVALAFAQKKQLTVRHILFTPLSETFLFPAGEAIAFHGTGDPWAETVVIKKACAERDIPLYITENANHSLETGHLETDLRILSETMETVAACLETCNVKNETQNQQN